MQKDHNFSRTAMLRALFGLALVAGLLLGFLSSAAAKGPVSATIIGPGIDEPMELIGDASQETSKWVALLMEQTGLWYATGDLPRPLDGGPPPELGPGYTLTWVNGGPPGASEASRTIVQTIYLDAANGPVIHTPEQKSLDGWGLGVVGWFAAPTGLPDTLAELGVPIWANGSFFERMLANLRSGMALSDRGAAPLAWIVSAVGLVLFLAGAAIVIVRRSGRPKNELPSRVDAG